MDLIVTKDVFTFRRVFVTNFRRLCRFFITDQMSQNKCNFWCLRSESRQCFAPVRLSFSRPYRRGLQIFGAIERAVVISVGRILLPGCFSVNIRRFAVLSVGNQCLEIFLSRCECPRLGVPRMTLIALIATFHSLLPLNS